MERIEIRQAAKEWTEEGRDRGATHLIVLYNTLESRHAPAFVYPEQDVEVEVVRLIRRSGGNLMIGVLCLHDDLDSQLKIVLKPPHMVVSRVEN